MINQKKINTENLAKTHMGGNVYAVEHDLSEVDKQKNRMQVLLIESVVHTVYELFEIKNICLEIGSNSVSFIMLDEGCEAAGEKVTGTRSPELSRDKIMEVLNRPNTPLDGGGVSDTRASEISGAIIDLILDRDNWPKEKVEQNRVHF